MYDLYASKNVLDSESEETKEYKYAYNLDYDKEFQLKDSLLFRSNENSPQNAKILWDYYSGNIYCRNWSSFSEQIREKYRQKFNDQFYC